MQAIQQKPEVQVSTTPFGIAIRYEWIAYIALIAFALVVRLAELDTVTLRETEAREALAAWRSLNPRLPGMALNAESPLLFWLHRMMFTGFGANELSVRAITAIAGAGLVVSPLLFRDLLGRERSFLYSVLLTFSPVLLLTSRFDSGVVWALWCVVGGLWALLRYAKGDRAVYGVWLAVFAAGLIFLTDAAGFMLFLVMVGAVALAWSLRTMSTVESENGAHLREYLQGFPMLKALLAVVMTVVFVATGLMLYPGGLANVAQLVEVGLRGVVTPAANMPFYPLIVSLFYEPVMWFFALATLWRGFRRGSLPLFERFCMAWLVMAVVAGLIYRGGTASHALWFTLPLTGLAGSSVFAAFKGKYHPFLRVPTWAKPLIALITLALLLVFTLNFQIVARALLQMVEFDFARIPAVGGIWSVVSIMLLIAGYFMAATLWGNRTALHGGAIGLLTFALVTSFGSGWNAAVHYSDDPVMFWHDAPAANQTFVLRETLFTFADREHGGMPRNQVMALVPEDSTLAWTLRDFTNLTFIRDVSEARGAEIILLPVSQDEPALGGSYVGQRFVTRKAWSPQTLHGLDFMAWWMQGRTRVPAAPGETYVLWVRQDIYDGAPFDFFTQSTQ